MIKRLIIISLITLLSFCVSFAQGGSDQDLAKQAQNPIANLMSFPFQNNINYKMGPDSNRIQNILNIQPVIPLYDGRLITRTILPLYWNPDYTQESGTNFGVGDLLFTAFYAPKSEGVTWGVGPAIQFPTGAPDFTTGKWSAGPSFVALIMPGQWVIGGLINNIWSFAGQKNKPDVNFFTFQPFINYNLTGFYFTFQPIITANWKAESGNQWTVPIGLGLGKLIKLGGKLPVNLNASYFYNVVTPDFAPQYQVRILAAVLLPASML